jgi:glutamate/tyrosine decarboxylase-like PLP-dependent enzyme
MRSLLEDAARRGIAYVESLNERAVAPDPAAVAALGKLDIALPDAGCDPAQVLALLDSAIGPATMAMAGPRFFGFVIGGSLPAALAASWLSSAWDQNAGLFLPSPGVAHLEQVALHWLNDLFGFAADTSVAFVTGATMANFTALAAARNAVLARAGWSVEADGLFGAPPIEVLVGAEAHPTLLKSLGMLGLGRARVKRIAVDGQGRMRADALPALSANTIVCAQAGNVNTGAFDPIGEICARVHAAGAWLHVDGAFGLWARTSPALRHLLDGIELADSCATDAHKWLNVPYDSGLAFVRDARALPASMAIAADYLPRDTPDRIPSDFTPELSRRARGVEIWAALLSLGRDGVRELIERNCAQARLFATRLADAGYEILNQVVLNQVLVSFGAPGDTLAIVAALQADGTCWCGSTVWQGRTAMRISVSSWATTDADVEKSAAAMIRIARATMAGSSPAI